MRAAKYTGCSEERQYLCNVSVSTVDWYRESFKWLADPAQDCYVTDEEFAKM